MISNPRCFTVSLPLDILSDFRMKSIFLAIFSASYVVIKQFLVPAINVFTSPTSNSGFKAPSAILKGEFGLLADKDFTPTFSGKHDNSILGVYNGDYEVAAIANSVRQRMERRGVIEKDVLQIVYKSATFPTTGYGHAHNLHPELVAKIKSAFWSFDFESDTTFKKEFAKADRFIGIRHKNDWAVIRGIDTANGVSYDCK